ncbi:MAG: hypothetical protein HF967_05685 [Methanosarcinales archaeon]|nr:hypothetical protein [Methanosarcinales archaeon]
MIVNPNVEKFIQKYIQNYLKNYGPCSIEDILHNYDSSIQINEEELRNTIHNALKTGNLQIIDEKTPLDKTIVKLSKSFLFTNASNDTCIVVSKPRLRELSIENIEKRNMQIDSVECFQKIITSAKEVIRICSPFMQKNVLNDDAFPELRQLIFDALKKNVKIRLLSRELFDGRGKEIQWIVDVADDIGKINNITIVDYHFSSENGAILSSTHAKLLIADFDMAYVGSAELRRNSLIANFEVGCLIKGPQVFGICEVFDFMFSKGSIWK